MFFSLLCCCLCFRSYDASKFVLTGPAAVNLRMCSPFVVQMRDANGNNLITDLPVAIISSKLPYIELTLSCNSAACGGVASWNVSAPSLKTGAFNVV